MKKHYKSPRRKHNIWKEFPNCVWCGIRLMDPQVAQICHEESGRKNIPWNYPTLEHLTPVWMIRSGLVDKDEVILRLSHHRCNTQNGLVVERQAIAYYIANPQLFVGSDPDNGKLIAAMSSTELEQYLQEVEEKYA